jgi:DNA-binding CsgD family transcriptional regulator
MLLYKGPFLKLNYEKEHKRVVNSWIKSPKNKEEFKSEILQYASLLKENIFHQILWLQSNFKFKLDNECRQWFDKTVNGPKMYVSWLTRDLLGYHHLYFVIGKDVLAHMEVMGLFEIQKKTRIKPRYFATEEEARQWLDGVSFDFKNKKKPIQINYKGTDKYGQIVIEIKDDPSQITSSIKALKTVLEESDFIKTNTEKYSSLTPREKETLKCITEGYLNKEISNKLEVSINTIRTHRNRIWKKLQISTLHEAIKYNVFLK